MKAFFLALSLSALTVSAASFDVWPASSGWKIPRSGAVWEMRAKELSVALAANEAEAVQLVVTTGTNAVKVTIAVEGDLRSAEGNVLPADCVEILRERYVVTTKPSDKTDVRGGYADPLPPAKFPLRLEANLNHPFWLRVKTAKDAKRGIYRGSVAVNGQKIPLTVEVFGFALPDTMTCRTLVGLQLKPIDQYHSLGKLKPQERRKAYDLYFRAMADYHFSVSAGPVADGDRWSVRWEDERPQFEWDAWDAAMRRGFEEYHYNAFSFLSALGLGSCSDTGRQPGRIGDVREGDPRYEARLEKLLGGIEAHLKERGWLDRCLVRCYDEPRPENDAFVCNGFAKLAKYAPGLKRLLTVWCRESLIGAPTIWCPTAKRFNDPLAVELRKKGETFWMYACMFPRTPYATIFLDHPSVEPRVWLWQCQGENVGGILLWSANFWTAESVYPDPERPQNPYADPAAYNRKGRQNCNGDGRFLYPPESVFEDPDARDTRLRGEPCFERPVGSIRGEMLRDGVEDYEYFEILKRLDPKNPLLRIPEDVSKSLTEFSRSPIPLEAHRRRLAKEIERLRR